MGKKNNKPKEPQEKQITGSGADIVSHEDEQGRVKCKCTVPCVWRGYRDEGDTVWIEKEMIEKDAFIKAHFEEVKSKELRVKSSDNADGAEGGDSASRGGRDGTDKGEGDGGDGNGQDELDLK